MAQENRIQVDSLVFKEGHTNSANSANLHSLAQNRFVPRVTTYREFVQCSHVTNKILESPPISVQS